MFNSAILDVVIGLGFVFILVSTLCSAIREGLEAWLKTRANFLERGLREMLHDPQGSTLVTALFQHPLIAGLYKDDYQVTTQSKVMKAMMPAGKNLPCYIPSCSFAITMMDMVARGTNMPAAGTDMKRAQITLPALRDNVGKLQNQKVERIMLAAIDAADGDLHKLQKNLEAWYDATMERVSGWYKRYTQWLILAIAVLVVGALNVNALRIADRLYHDQAMRSALVAAASSGSPDMPALSKLDLPIGWAQGWSLRNEAGAWNDWVGPVLGLLITVLAAMLGAPFWFDVLSKVMNLRASVRPRQGASDDDRPASVLPMVAPPISIVVQAPALAAGPADVARPAAQGNGVNHVDAAAMPDGCGGPIKHPTPDEDVPPAHGGVA
jgi:hypothetical protein